MRELTARIGGIGARVNSPREVLSSQLTRSPWVTKVSNLQEGREWVQKYLENCQMERLEMLLAVGKFKKKYLETGPSIQKLAKLEKGKKKGHLPAGCPLPVDGIVG